jgi:hypothetical protein
MKRLILILILVFSFQSIANSEQEWIKKKKKNKWITKNENTKIEWITKKSKNNDLAYISLLPLVFAMFYIKRLYSK